MNADVITLPHHQSDQEALIKFINIYTNLSANNLHSLESIYSENILFIDPAHHIQGFSQLLHYFHQLFHLLFQIVIVLF